MVQLKPYCSELELLELLTSAGIDDKVVLAALKQANHSHRFHCRDDGAPYLTQHIFPMVRDVYNYFSTQEEKRLAVIITLLHDVPEKDHIYSPERLNVDFGDEIATLVKFLLKPVLVKQVRSQQDRHDEQVEFMKMINKSPRICKVIKTFDRLNNLICTDAHRDIEKYTRFIQDTVELYVPLAHSVDESLAVRMEEEIARLRQELHS